MSELELLEFRTRAEELVDLPDLAELESRGRRLRQRRMALGAGVAAAVLAVTGGLVMTQRDDDGDSTPVEPPDDRAPAEVVDYPGPLMEILDAGTYVLQPSGEDDAPRAQLTVPEGWNAWEGPNRFDDDLETTGWYAGLLVVDPFAVSSRLCTEPQGDDHVDGSAAALVEAIERIPGLQVTALPETDELFGHKATHLEVRATRALRTCDDPNANLISTERQGIVSPDTPADLWVVDVEEQAYLVIASSSPTTPPEIQQELYAIVDSIEFVEPE
jgi:hypothetical protein